MLNSKEVKELLIEVANMFIERRDQLSRLDSLIGDGDHGISMARGAKAAIEVLQTMEDTLDTNEYFKAYGRTLVRTIGGAIGPLFGIIFTELGKCTKDEAEFNKKAFVNGISNATMKIMEFGGAHVGDKTMIDVMHPLSIELKSLNLGDYTFKELSEKAHVDCLDFLEKTKPLLAKKGRSKFLMEGSIGYQDAGATSFTYLIEVINTYLERK